jgi:hypothetical protein
MGWMRILKRPWNWAYLEFAAIAMVFAVILVAYAVSRLVTSN